MNDRQSLLRELSGPRPLCRVDTAKLGYWHPSALDIAGSGVTDSHPLSLILEKMRNIVEGCH